MSNYRRFYQKGGCYFFTVVTHGRQHVLKSWENINILRESFQSVMRQRPFHIDAMVVLPDHIHCIWTLPDNDMDFSTRWRLIKRQFSSRINALPAVSPEKKVWQRRFWEHWIRDDHDFYNHMNYIHYNPVKHGYASRPDDWEYSSYRKKVAQGACPVCDVNNVPDALERNYLE
ncbi:MAG: transposase [Desulfosalsimonadaceae bacterium]